MESSEQIRSYDFRYFESSHKVKLHSFTSISLMILAGLPARTTLSPKDLVTTAPAPTTTLSPKVTPGRMISSTTRPEVISNRYWAHIPLSCIPFMRI